MTAQELIKHLQILPPTTKIVVRGYEDGYNDILKLKEVKIKAKADAYWFDGEFENSNDAYEIIANNLILQKHEF